jgi:K+-transporting ATPase ATPase C chain
MKTLKIAIILFALMSLCLGILYPLAITGIAQLFFPYRANGSLIYKQEKIVGSELIGQSFTSSRYFHGRPSAVDNDGSASRASNYGPTEAKWQEILRIRITDIKAICMLDSTQSIPADLVMASASGLDPHISLQAAMLQVPRISKARSLDVTLVRSLVITLLEKSLFNSPRINVLKLNLALDKLNEEHLSDREKKP